MIMPGRGEWIGLSALSVILAGAIAFEIVGPAPQPSLEPANIVTPVRDVQSSVAQPPDQHGPWLNEILARPLFSPDRRPAGIVSDVRGLPRLTGIIVSDTRRIAIFASASGDHAIVGEVGTHIGVYEVKAVDDAGVTVLGPGGTSVIRPLFDSGPPPVKHTPPAPAPTPPVLPRVPVK
jgi:hypothetical protein